MKGWAEGIGAMVAGEKRRLWVPADLAYQDGKSGAGPAGPLVFDVELVRIIPRPAPPEVPADLAAPPPGAQRLKSGVALRVLEPGSGSQHPGPGSVVEIHYSAWAADRRRFESTVTRGQPATVRLDAPGVIEGWRQAIPQMVVGEKARVWIPVGLGYGEKVKGGPLGPLVYDIQLLAIR
jgi:peptidylprolyl isomerase